MTAFRPSSLLLFAMLVWLCAGRLTTPAADGATNSSSVAGAAAIQGVSASSSTPGQLPQGAVDGDRFSIAANSVWKGGQGESSWYWQADFGVPVEIGSVLQVLGDDESTLSAAPLSYVWQVSGDGATWRDLETTRLLAEHRMYRIHRLKKPVRARHLRLAIAKTGGEPPAIREIEVYPTTTAIIQFPAWILCVNSFESPSIEDCHRFLDLARRCNGWNDVTGQYVWHGLVDPAMALAEPRPLCAFYTGSFRDWCEVDSSTWKGTEQLLNDRSLPMWGACGGAQAFGILAETGADGPWDCPKCREPENPKLPIYGHIGLIDPTIVTVCGDYSNNIYESGPTRVRLVQADPVFVGLPDEFEVPENHCGQLEYLPAGWDLIVAKAKGGKTWMQCMKRRDACIYAAQFHIELPETPGVSRRIMSNFLAEAVVWSQNGEASANAEIRQF